MTTQEKVDWRLKGAIIGACSCDWGCPCNFDAPPTNYWCQGGYTWQIAEGRFGDTVLDGLHISLYAESPGPMHEGHLTTQFIVDEKANEQQREALLTLLKGGVGGPFAVFSSVTETLLDPIYAPYEVSIDGLNSRVKVAGVVEVELDTVKNPVTGAVEELQLVKPTGFTSTLSHLGMSLVYRYTGGFQHDHSGKYAEYAAFEYSAP